jgi:hypothetical protein
MKTVIQFFFILASVVCTGGLTYAQTKATPTPSPTSPRPPSQTGVGREVPFSLADYGVAFKPDARLIVVMAALDAAGFDPVSEGRAPSVFRARVRQDQIELAPALKEKLRSFYEHNKLPATATPAEQAARYVSLAYVLGQPPLLEAPERSEELPAGVLEVLDFAPLLREFYRRSGMDERMGSYIRACQSEGDRLRPPASEMVRSVLTYLHTRPILTAGERVLVKAPGAKKKDTAARTYVIREHERHFYIVPDMLAAPGTINLRVIADDYYAIVPEGTDPASSELRRAYLQFVIDPLALRFNKEIAARRDQIKQLLKTRETEGDSVTPDVFIAVSRSLVAGVDARYNELVRLQRLAFATRDQLVAAKDQTARAAITKDAEAAVKVIQDDSVAQLADEYEHGAVLAFYFADQMRDVETSGFDITNFLPDMIASFDPVREARRPSEYAAARARSVAARKERLARRVEVETPTTTDADSARANALIRELSDIEQVLQQKDYSGAETRLRALMRDYPREPRIFFAMAQTASVAAADATDEVVQAQRLNNALSNYRLAIEASSPETDRALLSRAHEAMGRIHAFFDRKDEAVKEFDAAISIGDVPGGAKREAIEGKKKLGQPK